MTWRVFIGRAEMSMSMSMSISRSLALVVLLLCAPAWSRAEPSPAAAKAAAATLKRDSAGCRVHADIDACYDALRWNPGDPALLVALGDALMLARRPADAIRNYLRAAELAPDTRGLAAKISAAEAKLASRRAPRNPSADGASPNESSGKQYSNAAPESQSH
jgi:cytochrome c-type biogenesis protein CcmH/NrfG